MSSSQSGLHSKILSQKQHTHPKTKNNKTPKQQQKPNPKLPKLVLICFPLINYRRNKNVIKNNTCSSNLCILVTERRRAMLKGLKYLLESPCCPA
jgi:hypothetical protein